METNKPISLVVEDMKMRIADAINQANLPPFIVESVVKDMLTEISIIAKKQYENDLKMYNDSLKKENTTNE